MSLCEYSASTSRRRCSKPPEPMLMLLGAIAPQRPLPRDEEHMTSDPRREDPPRRRVVHGWPRVVRKRGAVVLEGCANAVLQRRRHQQTDRQHHQQGHDPLRRFEGTRCGPKAGGLEEATATFHRRVTLLASEPLLDGQAGLVECIGGEADTPLPVDT